MLRWVAAVAAVLGVFALLGAPVQAACGSDGAAFADTTRHTLLEIDRSGHRLLFTTEDGRQLVGENARFFGKTKLTAVSSSARLTIFVRADLSTGRADASAIERDRPGVHPPGQQVDPGRHVHLLSVMRWGSAGGCDATPTAHATPTPRATQTAPTPTAVVPTPSPTAIAGDAVAYQIDAEHDGASTTDVGRLPLAPKWSVDFGQLVSYPLVVGDRVFITTGNTSTGLWTEYGTNLRALTLDTGATLWGPVPIDGNYWWSNAAYDGGRLFVVNADALLRAFDASNGALLWTRQLSGLPSGAVPVAADGFVYVSTSGSIVDTGALYAVDQQDGKIRWRAPTHGGDNSSPAVWGGTVFASSECDNAAAFEDTTGRLLWQHSVPCPGGYGAGLDETSVVAGGAFYARSAGATAGSYRLDAATGRSITQYPDYAVPAVRGSIGVITAVDRFAAFDVATSAERWRLSDSARFVAPPIVVGGNAYALSRSGTLYGVDIASGAIRWQASVGERAPVGNGPTTGLAAADGVLLVPFGSTLTAFRGA